jgi:hypothetical protein
MTLYTRTYETGGLLLETRSKRAIEFKDWGENKGEILAPAILPVRELSLTEGIAQEQATAPVYGSSFSGSLRGEKTRVLAEVPLLNGIDAHGLDLTSKERGLLRNLWAIIISKALQTSFPVKRAEIGIFRDSAEDRKQVLVRLFVEANASQTMAFWESLEGDIEEWVAILSESDRLIFLRNVSMRIHWQ